MIASSNMINMNAVKSTRKTQPRLRVRDIPASFVYEVMDGKPIYYKGYREALEQGKTAEEIIGSSTLQGIIIEYILRLLFRNLDEKKYHILTNEQGLHLNKRNNLSADIAIYAKADFSAAQANKRYASIAPKVQIEVDVSAEITGALTETSYINHKTDKLFQFGVEKVIWVLSDSKKIIVAVPNDNWQIIDWHKDIEVLDGLFFCVGKYLQEEGSPFA